MARRSPLGPQVLEQPSSAAPVRGAQQKSGVIASQLCGAAAVQTRGQPGELFAYEDDSELSGKRPDLLEELDKRSLGLGHEAESTAQPGQRVRCRRLDSLAGRRGVGRAGL
jgi:hypothetical protein